MIRKDVYHQAERLNAASGLGTDSIYNWLMDVGRSKSRNPTRLDIRATDGMVYLHGEADDYQLARYVPPLPRCPAQREGTDYEALILARQEAWMD